MDHKKNDNINNDNLILISIMTYYAKQIFSGTKKFEFRKSPLRKSDLNKQIFVYSQTGISLLLGLLR